jgi:Tfp pilus assembly protein FimT
MVIIKTKKKIVRKLRKMLFVFLSYKNKWLILATKNSKGFFTSFRMTIFGQSVKGFTMIEMLVSIGIIIILAATFLANYHGAKKFGELNMAAQKLASDIRLTQSYALDLKEKDDSIPVRWGVYFNKTVGSNDKYIIYADAESSNNQSYNIGEEYFIYNLAQGVTIKDIKMDNVSIFNNTLYLTFALPEAEVQACRSTNGNNCASQKVEIVLTNNEIDKTVLINIMGLIDVE